MTATPGARTATATSTASGLFQVGRWVVSGSTGWYDTPSLTSCNGIWLLTMGACEGCAQHQVEQPRWLAPCPFDPLTC